VDGQKIDRKAKDKANKISMGNEPVCSLSQHIGNRNILFLFHTLVLFFLLTLSFCLLSMLSQILLPVPKI